jgi:hypothetical protein
MSLATTHRASSGQRDQVHKGRGAALNLEGRFEQWQREAFDDGWVDEGADSSDAEVVRYPRKRWLHTKQQNPLFALMIRLISRSAIR